MRAVSIVWVLFLSCASVASRRYSMPLSSEEGVVVVPALVSTAESMGLRAANHQTSAQVRLADGTSLWWMPWGSQFVLSVQLPQSPEGPQLETAFHDAKVRADEIWTAAVQARQANNIGATVMVPSSRPAQPAPRTPQPYVPPPYEPGAANPPHYSNPPQPQYSDPPSSNPPQYSHSPTHSGAPAGAACRFSSDCAGGNCRQNVCMGQGGSGAPCWFSSDCNSGSCNSHVCR